MVIELSGVQFGGTSMISDQNGFWFSLITTLLHPFWNLKIHYNYFIDLVMSLQKVSVILLQTDFLL